MKRSNETHWGAAAGQGVRQAHDDHADAVAASEAAHKRLAETIRGHGPGWWSRLIQDVQAGAEAFTAASGIPLVTDIEDRPGRPMVTLRPIASRAGISLCGELDSDAPTVRVTRVGPVFFDMCHYALTEQDGELRLRFHGRDLDELGAARELVGPWLGTLQAGGVGVRGQVRSLLFLAGFVSFVGGLAAWSVPLAAVVCGGVVMVVTAFPYVRGVQQGISIKGAV